MNTIESNSIESIDFDTNELDSDSSVVNYDVILKPDLKTILNAQLAKNIKMQNSYTSMPNGVNVFETDSYNPFDQLSSEVDKRITISASMLLNNALRRARDSSLN